MKHIICVGACYLDTILVVPQFPTEDSKLRATALSRRLGGNCPNTLAVLEQFVNDFIHLHLVSVLPAEQSVYTKFIRDAYTRVKLDASCIYRSEHDDAPSSYIIQNSGTKSRTIINYNNLPEMTVDELIHKAQLLAAFPNGDEGWYHFEGRIPETILPSIQYLRTTYPRIKISVEVEKPGREGLQELANVADVVFYSRSWAEGNNFTSARLCLGAQAQLTRPNALLLCTWGAAGATALQKSSNGTSVWCTVDAWAMEGREVKDTVGAGDTFIAGMLFALNQHGQDWELAQKLKFANEVAGRKVIQVGFGNLAGQFEY
ncbi:Ribokinase-like protein [Phaeosphaeriaceae sp. PMI808]|nr:Ribokinase-like protein [Phaeosphaeriaceae sp. PMI808]